MVSTSDTLLLLAAQFRNGEITKEELLKALEKATSNVQGLGSSASQLPSSSAPAQTTDGLTPVSPSLPTKLSPRKRQEILSQLVQQRKKETSEPPKPQSLSLLNKQPRNKPIQTTSPLGRSLQSQRSPQPSLQSQPISQSRASSIVSSKPAPHTRRPPSEPGHHTESRAVARKMAVEPPQESFRQMTLSDRPNGPEFYDRMMKWQSERDCTRQQSKEELNDLEEACTFHPRLNQHSRAVSYEGNKSASERLYEHATLLQERKEIESKMKQRDEDDEMRKTCTFQPTINTRSQNTRSKYRMPKKNFEPEPDRSNFTPQINPVKPGMASATAYLKEDTFSRLTKSTKTQSPVKKGTSYTGSDSKPVPTQAWSSEGLPSRQSDSPLSLSALQSDTLTTAPPASLQSKEERQSNFDAFMQRQSDLLAKKAQKAAESKPRPSPMLNTKSREMVRSTFQERLDADASRREQSRIMAIEQQSSYDEEIMDRNKMVPNISLRGLNKPSRSDDDRSAGDLLRKQALNELLVQERDAIEKAQTPHKPQIKRMPNVSSRVTEEALSGAWQKRQGERMLESQLAREAKEDAEMKECTFQPEINSAPDYVHRIAYSMRLSKVSRPKPPKEKPAMVFSLEKHVK